MKVTFDPALPICAKREEVQRAVKSHPVTIVCGETGSGKTTQLPKMLLEIGRGSQGMIGHTQPRRIAARSVAARISEELGVELGSVVGYKVRFNDRVSGRTAIKLMTDGILLAETQGDRLLRRYDTIVIDEAHERSLNIDFLLGYLKRLVEGGQRPDLKVVITSATIDAERFSRHFGGAPVIEVSGRLYPVEVRYRPVGGDTEDTTREEEEQALVDAVEELLRAGDGDVLVFLPGEREIRDTADILAKARQGARNAVEIVPLFGRLSAADQDRVFHPGGARRVVLATNVAETSLTVPRIRYVVDTGLARVKRYSYRNKVEQLHIEPVSQAAARQRAGRCGRIANGICVRLWSEEEQATRPEYTDPEILRSSLAAVILRAASLDLGDVEAFPFLDPPPPRAIADGYGLLAELGAVDDDRAITDTGRQLARLPLDPRVGRMLIAAREEHCLDQVLIIASALSVQDPRERPLEQAARADEKHARFADERSDFLGFLKLWSFYEISQSSLSNRKLAQACKEHFLSVGRLREWRDVWMQLRQAVLDLDWKSSSVDASKPEGYRAIHRALLAGLLGNVGFRDEAQGAHSGARGIKFWVHPGSSVRKPGRWIMAGELVETTRLYARTVAAVDPAWIEDVGRHLLKRHQDNPHWEKSRAQVVAMERGTLFGLPVYVNRRVHYGPLDPATSRDIFIRRALVEGEFDTRAPFYSHNKRLIEDIERLEHKSRRPDILVDDELIRAFYDARIPDGLHNGADFEKWRREAEAADPKRLFLRREDLMRHEAAGITTENFPARLRVGSNEFALEYHFEPGSPKDGVTLVVPAALLNQIPAARCDWLVLGMLREKVRTLAKSLPQRLRHKLGALDDFAERFVASETASDMPLAGAVSRHVRLEYGIALPNDALRPDTVPPHLRMNFRVLGEDGRTLAQSRDLSSLKREFGAETRAILQSEAPLPAGEPQTAWTFGDLDEVMEIQSGNHKLVGYPALVDVGEGVVLQVFDSPEKAAAEHRAGVRRLLASGLKDRVRDLEKSAARNLRLAPLAKDLVSASLDRCFLSESLPYTDQEFSKRTQEGRARFNLIGQELQRLAEQIVDGHAELQKRLAAAGKAFPEVADDIRRQVERLLSPGWLARNPWARLQHFPRYLRAAIMRLEKLRADPVRDRRLAAEFNPLHASWQREIAMQRRSGRVNEELELFGWLLEELRVAMFAQELKTPMPMSAKRLGKQFDALRAQGGRR